MSNINFRRRVDYNTIIKALQSAATEFGWSVDVQDHMNKEYDVGSPVTEREVYHYTQIALTSGGRIMFTTEVDKGRQYISSLQAYIRCREEEFRPFLDAFSKYL